MIDSAEKKLEIKDLDISFYSNTETVHAIRGVNLILRRGETVALDVTIQERILELIVSLQQKRSLSVIYITHHLMGTKTRKEDENHEQKKY